MTPLLWIPPAGRYHSGSTQSNNLQRGAESVAPDAGRLKAAPRVAALPHTGVAGLRLEPPTASVSTREHTRKPLLNMGLFDYTWNSDAWHMGCNEAGSAVIATGRGNDAEAENSGPADGSGRSRAAFRQARPAARAPGGG